MSVSRKVLACVLVAGCGTAPEAGGPAAPPPAAETVDPIDLSSWMPKEGERHEIVYIAHGVEIRQQMRRLAAEVAEEASREAGRPCTVDVADDRARRLCVEDGRKVILQYGLRARWPIPAEAGNASGILWRIPVEVRPSK